MKLDELITKRVGVVDLIAGALIADSKVGTRVFKNPYYGLIEGRTVPWDAFPEARPEAVKERNKEFSKLMKDCRREYGMYEVEITISDEKIDKIRKKLEAREDLKGKDYIIDRIINAIKRQYPKVRILSGAAKCAAKKQGYDVSVKKVLLKKPAAK